jgi:regulator of chromosome condensation
MHCVALTHDNLIITWGVNDLGALGRDATWVAPTKDIDGDSESSDEDDQDSGLNPKESTSTAIPANSFPNDVKFVQVAASDSASFALTADGEVYGWGTFRVSYHLRYALFLANCCRAPRVWLASPRKQQ